jgi:hypothetical protein
MVPLPSFRDPVQTAFAFLVAIFLFLLFKNKSFYTSILTGFSRKPATLVPNLFRECLHELGCFGSVADAMVNGESGFHIINLG